MRSVVLRDEECEEQEQAQSHGGKLTEGCPPETHERAVRNQTNFVDAHAECTSIHLARRVGFRTESDLEVRAPPPPGLGLQCQSLSATRSHLEACISGFDDHEGRCLAARPEPGNERFDLDIESGTGIRENDCASPAGPSIVAFSVVEVLG
jgi:hypothetical protein